MARRVRIGSFHSYYQKFGDRVRNMRSKHGWTQAAAAARMKAPYEVSRSSWSAYESGIANPEMPILLEMCRILGTDPNTLLGYKVD